MLASKPKDHERLVAVAVDHLLNHLNGMDMRYEEAIRGRRILDRIKGDPALMKAVVKSLVAVRAL